MKRHVSFFFLLVGLLLSSAATAQFQMADPGFEDWTGSTFDGKIQPAYWHYCNVTQFNFKFNFSQRVEGRTGYAAKVEDQAMKVAGINGGTSPGYISSGQPWAYVPGLDNIAGSTAGTHGGFAFTHRPDTVTVWIKREGKNWSKENYNIVFYLWQGTSLGRSYPSDNGCTKIPKSESGVEGGGWEDEESDIRIALDANTCGTERQALQVGEALFYEKAEYTDWHQVRVPVLYMNDQIPEKGNLILSAGNYPAGKSKAGFFAGNSLTVDDVELIYSSKIQKLFVGNKEWRGFDPNSQDVQTYSLGQGMTTIPAIYAVRGAGVEVNCNGESATFNGRRLTATECQINTAGAAVDGAPVVITVHAEDGSSTTTYRIQFVSQASSNAMLSDIRVNGTTITGFNPYLTNYQVALPYGTTAAPVVSCDVQDAGATYTMTQPAGTNGSSVITVTAQDGTQKTYTLNFSVAELSDNTLSDILLDGVSLDGFAPTRNNYTVSLPLSTTAAPVITPVSAYPAGAQTIQVLENSLAVAARSGVCRIQVSAPAALSARTYRLTYKLEASSNAQLNMIYLDGAPLSDFASDTYAYSIDLAEGVTTLPAVTWEAGDAYQEVTSTATATTVRLSVLAGDGVTRLRYTLTFNFARSFSSLLKMIYLDGDSLPGFVPETLDYQFTYTGSLPVITYDKDEGQSVFMVLPTGPGQAKLTVQPEVGEPMVYTLTFADAAVPSPAPLPEDADTLLQDAQLSAIFVDGELIDGFEPTILDYTVSLLPGTEQLPEVSVRATHFTQLVEQQTVLLDSVGLLYATVTLTSVAESGDTLAYTIHFIEEQPQLDNVLLAILVDGVGALDLTSGDTFTIELPYGTTAMPAITYVKNYSSQHVVLTDGGLLEPTQLTVFSGREGVPAKVYTLFTLCSSYDDVMLLDLKVNGATVSGFAPDLFNYVVSLPDTMGMPLVEFTAQAGTTTEVLAQNKKQYILLAENESIRHTYTVTFYYPTSQIPNMDFSAWTPTRYNNAEKPTGWTAPADVAEKYTYYFMGIPTGTYSTGREVQRLDGGVVKLESYFDRLSISSSICGMMTTGDMAINFASAGNSSSSVSGSIPFLNSPDTILLDAKPVSHKNMNTWRILATINGTRNVEYEGSYASLNSWQTARVVLPYAGENLLPSDINLTINCANTENCNDWAGLTSPEHDAVLHVRDLRLRYCSTLSGVEHAGQSFALEGHVFTLQVDDPDYLFRPALHFIGDVADQQQTPVVWGAWENGTLTGRFTNYGENGQDHTDYELRVIRPLSSNTEVDYLWSDEGDLTVLRRSPYQHIVVTTDGYSYTISVTAEDGSKQDHYIAVPVKTSTSMLSLRRTDYSSNASLSSISISGQPLAQFDEAIYSYTVVAPQLTEPQVTPADSKATVFSFTVNQSADVVTFIYVVRAEDGTSAIYMVQELIRTPQTDAYLTDLQMAGQTVAGFTSEQKQYDITLPWDAKSLPDMLAVPSAGASVMLQTAGLLSDTLIYSYRVVAEDGLHEAMYQVRFTLAPSEMCLLSAILADGAELAAFDEETFSYVIDVPFGAERPQITAVPVEPRATVTISSDGESILVTAVNPAYTATYTLTYHDLPSTNSLLQGLLIDGEELADFASDDFEYILPVTKGATVLPTVTPLLADTQQVVSAEAEGMVLTLTVRSGSGEESTYTITFVEQPSSNWHLLSLSVHGELLADFHRDSLQYVLTYPVGTPEASLADVSDVIAVPEEETTQVLIQKEQDGTILVQTTAEDGSVGFYVIEQQITQSSNALLEGIYLDSLLLYSFDAETFTYTYLLPQGAILPAIDAVAQDSLTEVFVTPAGVGDTTYIFCVAQDGTELVYAVYFDYASFNSGARDKDIDDCKFVHIPGTNSYMAVTIRSNIHVMIGDFYGHRLMYCTVPVCDPNFVRVEKDADGDEYIAGVYLGANGAVFEVPALNQPYYAVFFKGRRRLAKAHKFILTR